MLAVRGRPRKDYKKNEFFGARLNDQESQMLEYIVEKTGETKSKIIIKALKMYYNLVRFQD